MRAAAPSAEALWCELDQVLVLVAPTSPPPFSQTHSCLNQSRVHCEAAGTENTVGLKHQDVQSEKPPSCFLIVH